MGINSAPKPSPTMATLIFRLLMRQKSLSHPADCKNSSWVRSKWFRQCAESHISRVKLSTANFRRVLIFRDLIDDTLSKVRQSPDFMAGSKKLLPSVFIGAAIFVFMVLWVRRNSSEPSYKGRPINYWFREYCLAWPNASGAPEPITDAIRAMGLGSDAVPYLVRELLSTNQDSGIRKWYVRLADSLPLTFKLLGSEAASAVPDLIEALNDPRIQWNAVAALGNAGSDGKSALPALNRLLDTGSNRDRLNIAAAIYKIDPTQSAAFAIIIDALKQKNDPKLRRDAAWTLRAMGPVARDAVSDLVEAVKDQNLEVWRTALDALKKIATDNRAAIPALLEKLNSPQAGDRINAAAWLVRIDPNEPHGLAGPTEGIQARAGAGGRCFA